MHDQDDENCGYIPFEIVLKTIKMAEFFPDEEIVDFLKFLAMCHS